MIRQIGLINLVGSWIPPDLRSPQLIEGAWNDWARYETFKRCVRLRSCPGQNRLLSVFHF